MSILVCVHVVCTCVMSIGVYDVDVCVCVKLGKRWCEEGFGSHRGGLKMAEG